ncbi:MAG: ABC transporter permease [Clostridiales Family XIII bacterium]|jgi:NitT/TauT family transport system permease protein|nr:ABC transporter permease [Clostridiales Family XIII bacterium]
MSDRSNNERKQSNILFRIVRKSTAIIIVLIIWLILPNYMHSMYIPPLIDILVEFKDLIVSGELLLNTIGSLEVVVIGLLIGQAVAIPLGALLGWFSKVGEFLDPLLQVIRATSILSILPLFVLFLGVGSLSKISIIIWGTFFPTLINTIQGVKNVDTTLIRSAQSMAVSGFGLFFKVILPGASPYILAGFRLSAGIALLVVVGAEMVGAVHGLGYMIFVASHAYQIPKMYVGILTLAILGVLTNFLIAKLENFLTRWQEIRVSI